MVVTWCLSPTHRSKASSFVREKNGAGRVTPPGAFFFRNPALHPDASLTLPACSFGPGRDARSTRQAGCLCYVTFVTGCLGFVVETVVSAACLGSCHAALRTTAISAETNPLDQPFAETAECCSGSAVDYSCCFTKFPFGSTSNRESLLFALTDTS